MLKYSHKETPDLEVLRLYTQSLEYPENPLRGINDHFTTCLRAHRGTLNNSSRGLWFEICCYDALRRLGFIGNAIQTVVCKSKDAEIDFAFLQSEIAIHAKTSLRERWRQADRDAAVFSFGAFAGFKPQMQILLMHREQKDSTVAQMQKRMQVLEEKAIGLDRCFSVIVPDHMEELRCLLLAQ